MYPVKNNTQYIIKKFKEEPLKTVNTDKPSNVLIKILNGKVEEQTTNPDFLYLFQPTYVGIGSRFDFRI